MFIAMSSGIPVAVTMLRRLNETSYYPVNSSCMPVELAVKPAENMSQKHGKEATIAVCLQVAFNNREPVKLIEWLEIQKLLGVSLVGIYNMNLVQPSLSISQKYAEEGFVDLRYSDDKGFSKEILLHGLAVINDCFYRHMYEFKYIIVIDFDELIVPDNFRTIQEMMSFLERNMSHTGAVNYVFRNSYFFTDAPNYNNASKLAFLKSDHKVNHTFNLHYFSERIFEFCLFVITQYLSISISKYFLHEILFLR